MSHNPDVHLLLFHTEGPPYDQFSDLTGEALTLESRSVPVFKTVRRFTPRMLIEKDGTWRETLQDRREWVLNHASYTGNLKYNANWAALNFQLWKPRLILEQLLSDDFPDGDILFYHDANISKYPDYRFGVERWARYAKRMMRCHDVLLFDDNHASIFSDTKQEVIDRYLGVADSKLHHLWAGALAVRKSPAGIAFATEWLAMCSDIESLSPLTKTSVHPAFVWHSLEQSILSVLWHLWVRQNKTRRMRCVYLRNTRRIPPPSKLHVRELLPLVRKAKKYVKRIFK